MLKCGTLDIDRYFKRIGYDGPKTPNLATLKRLCWCHGISVPEDTMDLFGGPNTKVFDLDVIYKNVVVDHRGGFCFELNGLFASLLQALGYSLELLKGSAFQRSRDVFSPPFDHLVIKVVIDGGAWLVDVGYGAPSFFEPIRFELMKPNTQMTGTYRLRKAEEENVYFVEKRKKTIRKLGAAFSTPADRPARKSKYFEDDEWPIVFKFSSAPHRWEDFRVGFNNHVTDEDGFSRCNSFLEMFSDGGCAILWGRNLIEKRFLDPETEEASCRRVSSDEELEMIMKEKFGVKLNFTPNYQSREFRPGNLRSMGSSD